MVKQLNTINVWMCLNMFETILRLIFSGIKTSRRPAMLMIFSGLNIHFSGLFLDVQKISETRILTHHRLGDKNEDG